MAMSEKNVLLSKANAAIRKSRPHDEKEWEYDIRKQVIRFPENPTIPVDMTFICFRSSGCSYDTRGECTMCNYNIHSIRGYSSSKRLANVIEEAISRNGYYEYLFMNPLGSMFDPREVPPDDLHRIYEVVATTNCTSFGFETRPEFITEERIAEFTSLVQHKKRIICIGLEASDPWILRNCVGKMMRPTDFQASVTVLKRHEINPVANILLGPPFLGEREAVNSAVSSIRWALRNGAYMCVLFPTYIKRWTLAHWLWQRNLYHSPSLWSLIEVLYMLGPELSQNVGLAWLSIDQTQSDLITDVPQTCLKCNRSVLDVLREYNARADFSLIESLRSSACDCRATWKKEMVAPVSPLYDRVVELYRRIALELIGQEWWNKNKNQVLVQLGEDYDSLLLEQGDVGKLE